MFVKSIAVGMLVMQFAALPAFASIDSFFIDRTVMVYPNAEKNKAFPMTGGSAFCDLHLRPENPWRIVSSSIFLKDDKTLWYKVSDAEYRISLGYAVNEYAVIKGNLCKPGNGAGESVVLPQFLVTVPRVDLQWEKKLGVASEEEKEDTVPAVITVSSDRADFAKLIVTAPKDDFSISDPNVTLSWDHANDIKVFDGLTEVSSGVTFLLAWGTSKTLYVQAVSVVDEVKFTLEGEPDNVSGERAVDYVKAACVEYVFVVYVDQPVAGQRRMYYLPPGGTIPDDLEVGHSFWEFKCARLKPEDDQSLAFFINKPMGFYPRDGTKIYGRNEIPDFRIPDDIHANSVDVTRSWRCSHDDFISGLRYCNRLRQQCQNQSIMYNLSDNNCTTAAINAGAACGIVLPRTESTWIFGTGVNPGDFGEDIREMP